MSRFNTTKRVIRFGTESLKQYSIDQEKIRKANPFGELFGYNRQTELQRGLELIGRILRKYEKYNEEETEK